jgi:hypothetical protein
MLVESRSKTPTLPTSSRLTVCASIAASSIRSSGSRRIITSQSTTRPNAVVDRSVSRDDPVDVPEFGTIVEELHSLQIRHPPAGFLQKRSRGTRIP